MKKYWLFTIEPINHINKIINNWLKSIISINKSINQSANQLINQQINQSIKKSLNLAVLPISLGTIEGRQEESCLGAQKAIAPNSSIDPA